MEHFSFDVPRLEQIYYRVKVSVSKNPNYQYFGHYLKNYLPTRKIPMINFKINLEKELVQSYICVKNRLPMDVQKFL